MWSKIWHYLLTSPFSPKLPSHLFMTQVVSKWLFIHKNLTKFFTVLPLSIYTWVSLVAQLVKNLPAMWDGEGNGTPLQYSCLGNPMDGGAWWAAVHGVSKNQTQLSDFTFTFHLHALEKEMATHSSVLVWRIPGTGEPGGLPSMGSHRVRHDAT